MWEYNPIFRLSEGFATSVVLPLFETASFPCLNQAISYLSAGLPLFGDPSPFPASLGQLAWKLLLSLAVRIVSISVLSLKFPVLP
jgi:hypothetical protein